jgi:hypothetical protein
MHLTKLLVNKKVHTKENGDVWRIVTETGESGNLDFAGEPSDEGLSGISLTNGSSNRHLYFLVDEYVNGNGDVVSDSFELKISNTKASVYFSVSPNLLNIVNL